MKEYLQKRRLRKLKKYNSLKLAYDVLQEEYSNKITKIKILETEKREYKKIIKELKGK
jgi:hypothetical protein